MVVNRGVAGEITSSGFMEQGHSAGYGTMYGESTVKNRCKIGSTLTTEVLICAAGLDLSTCSVLVTTCAFSTRTGVVRRSMSGVLYPGLACTATSSVV